jgi:hypothetical protein
VSRPTRAWEQRWRGHRSPPHAGAVGHPPRLLHAPHMRPPLCVPYLALLRSKGEAQTPSSTPRASSQSSSPCCRLLSSAVITSSAPAPTPHLRPHLCLPEHHRALGYLTDLSFLTNEHPSDHSPELSLRPSSPPPRAHTGEPPSVQKPKLGSSSSRACATAISSPAPAVGRSDFTGEPLASGGGGDPPPCFPGWAETAEEAGLCRTGLRFGVGQLGRPQ